MDYVLGRLGWLEVGLWCLMLVLIFYFIWDMSKARFEVVNQILDHVLLHPQDVCENV